MVWGRGRRSFHAVFLGHSGQPNHPGVTEAEGGRGLKGEPPLPCLPLGVQANS